MIKIIQHNAVNTVLTPSEVTEQRATWILLCVVILLVLWISGTSLLVSTFVCAIASLPAIAQIMTSKLQGETSHELEMAVWIVVVMIGATATGGAVSAVSVAFFIPVVTALSLGRKRQAIEASAFSVLGFCLAALLSRMGFLPIEPKLLDPAPAMFALVSLIYMASLVRKIQLADNSAGTLARVREQASHQISRLSKQKEILVNRLETSSQRLAHARKEFSQEQDKNADLERTLDQRALYYAKTSHELRTPLNAILGFSEVMKEELYGELPEKYKEYAQMIHEGGKSLQLTVDDVLDLTKIESGNYEIRPEKVSLTEIMWDMVRFLSDQARRSEVKLSVSSKSKDVEAFADPRAVRQIAQNLVSNAIKFTPHGGSIAITVREDEESGAWLSVKDTGAGIDPEVFEDILKPFVQTEAANKANKVGTGLGLSVANAFAKLHGGYMQLDSEAGEGSVISVFFPEEGKHSQE